MQQLQISFGNANITLIQKSEKDSTKKEIINQYFSYT